MQLNGITNAGIATSVWAAAARTLTQSVASAANVVSGAGVTSVDNAGNAYEADVVGNKSDAQILTPNTTAGLIAYAKGGLVLSRGATQSETIGRPNTGFIQLTPNASANTKGSYVTLKAGTSGEWRWIDFVFDPQTAGVYCVDIAVGGAGVEVLKYTDLVVVELLGAGQWTQQYRVNIDVPSGSTVRMRASFGGAGGGDIYVVGTGGYA